MKSTTQHALWVLLWQTIVACAMMAIALLVETFTSYEVPRSVAALGVMLGAQTYAMSQENKFPGTLDGVVIAVALRASLASALVQVGLTAVLLTMGAHAETSELTEVTQFLTSNWWPIPACIAVTFLITFVLTRFALLLGIRSARRGRATPPQDASPV